MMVYSSGALGGLEVVEGGLVGGELAHVLNAQAAAHAAASAAAHQQQQQQIAVQQIKTSPSSGRSTPVATTAGTTSPSPSKLFVGGLSWQTSSEKLREYFAMFGPVTDVLIMKDPVTQGSLCGVIYDLFNLYTPHQTDLSLRTLDARLYDFTMNCKVVVRMRNVRGTVQCRRYFGVCTKSEGITNCAVPQRGAEPKPAPRRSRVAGSALPAAGRVG
ncbi:jg14356 [Pararge aegeria aegeria]|uniref:Jg14356 protein n=1 Tax=Pararge aegeria aegeria TaxID=348720 RepID=A0A8S4RA87_9NEOP|nr:jg14356 [Pararge aegeria aegeria]